MKFFIDSADVDEVEHAAKLGVIHGVTTNPSLVADSGRDFKDVIIDICELVDGPVSVEVTATDVEGMIEEGRRFDDWAHNVVVKVPLMPEGLQACRTLDDDGIDVNVTLCFSVNQALLAARAGARFISPFVGRLDDIGHDGMDVARDIVTAYGHYEDIETDVLVASVRHPRHVTEAALAGADVATLPHDILTKMFQHPKTDLGLEKFLSDWNQG
jgi:transaldolase